MANLWQPAAPFLFDSSGASGWVCVDSSLSPSIYRTGSLYDFITPLTSMVVSYRTTTSAQQSGRYPLGREKSIEHFACELVLCYGRRQVNAEKDFRFGRSSQMRPGRHRPLWKFTRISLLGRTERPPPGYAHRMDHFQLSHPPSGRSFIQAVRRHLRKLWRR